MRGLKAALTLALAFPCMWLATVMAGHLGGPVWVHVGLGVAAGLALWSALVARS